MTRAPARWRPHTHARSDIPKQRYETMAEASAAARKIAADDLDAGRWRNSAPSPYECSDPTCGGFHVGNWSDDAWAQRPKRDRSDVRKARAMAEPFDVTDDKGNRYRLTPISVPDTEMGHDAIQTLWKLWQYSVEGDHA